MGTGADGGVVRVAGALGALLALFLAAPVAVLALSTAPGGVAATLADPAAGRAAVTSLAGATAATAVSLLFGVPLAYWLARGGGRLRAAVTTVVVLPLVLPPTVAGVVLLAVVGPGTALADAAAALGVRTTRSLVGVVLAQTFVAAPFTVLTARAGFADVDRSLEEAARTMGATPWRTVRRVTLPLASRSLLAGATLTFARAVGEFGATVVLAYYPRTLPVAVWVGFQEGGLSAAFPLSALLVVLSVAVVAALRAVGGVRGA